MRAASTAWAVAGTRRPWRTGHAICTALPGQDSRLDQRSDAFLQEERVALGPLDQEPLERAELVSFPSRASRNSSALSGGQGIDPELPVVGLAPHPWRYSGR